MNYQVLVIGHGSIGARHARLAHDIGCDVICVSKQRFLPYSVVKSIEEASQYGFYNSVIIATPTSKHFEHLEALNTHVKSNAILVEKPLCCPKRGFTRVASNHKVYVAYNLRFHLGIIRLRQLLQDKNLTSLHLHVGQYLPTWRPQQDYSKGYSAHRNMGGGVLRDLSHELDLACVLGGPWIRTVALGGKFSELRIDSDDSFTLLSEHESCPAVTIHLDYLQNPARRHIVAVVENHSYMLDLINGILQYDDKEERFHVERDDTYRAQLRALLYGEDADLLCTYTQGVDVDRYIEAAEISVSEQRWVAR